GAGAREQREGSSWPARPSNRRASRVCRAGPWRGSRRAGSGSRGHMRAHAGTCRARGGTCPPMGTVSLRWFPMGERPGPPTGPAGRQEMGAGTSIARAATLTTMPITDRPHAAAQLLPPATVRELSRPEPHVALLRIALEWARILGAAGLATRFFHPVTYVLAVAFIGARHHTLLILMHDAAHHRLAPNRRATDWIGELVSWPF